MNFEEINRAACAAGLAELWLPSARKQGQYLRVGNIHNDKGNSLAINIQTGAWIDHASDESGGDLISLYASMHNLRQWEAAKQIQDIHLGGFNTVQLKRTTTTQSETIAPINDNISLELPYHRLGTPSKVWWYKNEEGKRMFAVCRFDHSNGKDVIPLTYTNNGWQWKGITDQLKPLYNLQHLVQNLDKPVLIVEGEKAADAATQIFPDYVVVTSCGGVNQAHKTDWSHLNGRSITFWPDNDEAGQEYIRNVISSFVGFVDVSTGVVNVSDFPHKWDLADELPDTLTIQDLKLKVLEAEQLNDDNMWPLPEISLIDGYADKAPVFPLQILGKQWQEWTLLSAKAKSAPTDYVVAGLLSSISALIGNSVWGRAWEEFEQPPVLRCCIVGLPSSGKSPALSVTGNVLRDLESSLNTSYQEDLQEYQRLFEQAKAYRDNWQADVKQAAQEKHPSPPMPKEAIEPSKPLEKRIVLNDATTEFVAEFCSRYPKGVLVKRDELAGWIESMDRYNASGGADKAFWLEAYEGSPFTVDRKSKGLENSIKIKHLSVSVIGGIQPDKLSDLLHKGSDDGQSARFLYFWPNHAPPSRPKQIPNHSFVREAFLKLYSIPMLMNEHDEMSPSFIEFEDQAKIAFQEYRVSLDKIIQGTSGQYASHIGKYAGLVVRLSLILELLWWSTQNDTTLPKSISLKAVTDTIALMDSYFMPMAKRAYGNAALQEDIADASAYAKWIVAEGLEEFNARALINNRIAGIGQASRRDKALQALENANWIKKINSTASNKGGRSKLSYGVNPRIFELI